MSAPSRALSREARLEPGPHVGYRFSDTGAVAGHRHLTVTTAPLLVTADGRRVVPNQAGFFLHLATGSLAGYEVQESPWPT